MTNQVSAPPWLLKAQLEMLAGVREVAGPGDSPRVVEYLKTTTLPASLAEQDETAWCAAFVNYCMTHSQAPVSGTNSARARSWLLWGSPVSIEHPPFGAVAVIKRGGSGQPGPEVIKAQGHVAFFLSYTGDGQIVLLGGNQSNAVNISSYSRERVLGIRWAV